MAYRQERWAAFVWLEDPLLEFFAETRKGIAELDDTRSAGLSRRAFSLEEQEAFMAGNGGCSDFPKGFQD